MCRDEASNLHFSQYSVAEIIGVGLNRPYMYRNGRLLHVDG
jgi:hypothetical protein